jgi:membrane associated rhomboid family serine protease
MKRVEANICKVNTTLQIYNQKTMPSSATTNTAKPAAAATATSRAGGSSGIAEQAQDALQQAESVLDTIEDSVDYYWDYLCDCLEDDDMPSAIRWISRHVLRRVTVEAPVIILFCFICVLVHVIQQTIWPDLNRLLAVQDRFDPTNPLQFSSLFTHVIAHDGTLDHIKGNMVHLLLVGPSAEHVYGSPTMLLVIGLVAVTSAWAHILLGSAYTHQLGASGVVFAVILLNSLVAAVSGTIPLSFLLTASIWCLDELIRFVWKTDNVSHHAHLTGAIVGTATAYYMRGGPTSLATKLEQKTTVKNASTGSGPGSASVKEVTPLQKWFRTQMAAIKTKTQ